ncbi:hypothetical protein GKD24_13355 [Lactobacillus paracasei]|uniref:hypothetical protein n=1 Tax=Lacticaseibacillus paracasei TaxID=1597 RepID=UPI000D3B93E3|nr:hypothetical protein [Lacticaseibacillus paracasei]PTS54190.1 hypothetical protein DBQ61_13740 [Lactobacillus sp. DS22_6]MBX4167053.1 hypothetical protein [Lacticaseibacillus paracasei]MCZ2753536.1 hypothetical protein [Lacticaseibacillus paracasei]MCZ2764000.1 hypothetical protein [Lacticaseibacillus paracasei]MCZ2772425.1 hypothetical protein [Lacticaseibacillus paracasei]
MWSAVIGIVSILVNIGIVFYNQSKLRKIRQNERLLTKLENAYTWLNEAYFDFEVSRVPESKIDKINEMAENCSQIIDNRNYLFSDTQKETVNGAISSIEDLSDAIYEYNNLDSNERSAHYERRTKLKKLDLRLKAN